jgi:hypothetical protein
MGWLLHALGLDTTSGPVYAFWSGAGSDLGEVALLGGMITLVRKHNCHERRCWRVGRHVVDGTPWCNHHHEAAREALR